MEYEYTEGWCVEWDESCTVENEVFKCRRLQRHGMSKPVLVCVPNGAFVLVDATLRRYWAMRAWTSEMQLAQHGVVSSSR